MGIYKLRAIFRIFPHFFLALGSTGGVVAPSNILFGKFPKFFPNRPESPYVHVFEKKFRKNQKKNHSRGKI